MWALCKQCFSCTSEVSSVARVIDRPPRILRNCSHAFPFPLIKGHNARSLLFRPFRPKPKISVLDNLPVTCASTSASPNLPFSRARLEILLGPRGTDSVMKRYYGKHRPWRGGRGARPTVQPVLGRSLGNGRRRCPLVHLRPHVFPIIRHAWRKHGAIFAPKGVVAHSLKRSCVRGAL